ncbi:acyl carrier protein [Thiorhodococcus mannitoliphagus]|uniref:Acyl carrier protein n=2 Tax=Thiorhodococcus mannitoliphagus TaxID=329406 RepID=A0A6P1DTF1_9GAMM|nr:acyl carrier protein [Thiorhodococcus mannitoliphagus]
MGLDTLERELIEAICTTCNLQDVETTSIKADDPLIGPESALGIDSLDALEIVVMVQKDYGVRIESENTSRIVLQSAASLASHIRKYSPYDLDHGE